MTMRRRSARRAAVVVAALMVAAVLQAAFATGAAADDRVFYAGNGYALVTASLYTSWDDANAAATSLPDYECEDVHLATITSPGEQAVITGLMAGVTANAWVGGFQPPGELSLDQGWQWVTGEAWGYANWADGEPNDTPFGIYIAGSEQYLEVYQGSGQWNDAPSPEPPEGAKYFVAEYENCPGARQPLDVEIVVEETILGGAEPFAATGPAVDRGILCPAGIVDEGALESRPGPGFIRLWVEKLFDCDDGTGGFTLELRVKIFPDGTTIAKWKVTAGFGAYDTLRGRGTLTGTPIVLGESILDVYTGMVRR